MIDIHTHILPGLDDGARDWAETMKMLGIAAEDGITAIVASPHYDMGRWTPGRDEILKLVEEANSKAGKEGIDIRILPGHEIRGAAGLVGRIERGEVLTIGGSKRYALVEFPAFEMPRWAEDLIFELEIADIIPVIAHPERNAGTIKDPNIISDLVTRGARIQINAGSLTGRFGREVRDVSERLLKAGLVHVVASDAHDARDRTPILSEAFHLSKSLIGEAGAEMIFRKNPARIIEGTDFWIPVPERITPGKGGIFGMFRRFMS